MLNYRDIPQCEQLMDIHQGRKVEMDTKEEKFNNVFTQAEALVRKEHYAREQINERIDNLRHEKNVLEEEWDIHWEDLQLSKWNDRRFGGWGINRWTLCVP